MAIQVLLSTYNGEKYIAAQIESIMAQTYNDVSLLIRDDGSEDNTVSCIEKCVKNYEGRIKFFIGKNIGVKQSFFELLQRADPSSSYYSFCDQDDVWMKGKLMKAVAILDKENNHQPLLYFTPTYLTDDNLTNLKIWPEYSRVQPSFYNALAENIVVGTTAVINHVARELLLLKEINYQHMIMHDWWAYLCISAFGKVIYDDEPSVLYRQHQGNLIGGNRNWIELLRRKWKSFVTNKDNRVLLRQALEFMECYGEELGVEKKQQLDLFIAPRKKIISRIRYLYRSELYRHSFSENLLFKFLILKGYI
ncbi:glycosyltransferase family 2 protein [Paenibacillus albidus]|uniref:glycosyltransferase family 2 protein n=1 Tax=Paenibacillus albidus TaxID=2041023 RepID=UPI001BEC8FDC|nr:glycosyltransferase family 2 protein [Paenibacillus albidus]MBT2290227.1 glycosyltransferase family 2 protein [Paenibacillus albidus]